MNKKKWKNSNNFLKNVNQQTTFYVPLNGLIAKPIYSSCYPLDNNNIWNDFFENKIHDKIMCCFILYWFHIHTELCQHTNKIWWNLILHWICGMVVISMCHSAICETKIQNKAIPWSKLIRDEIVKKIPNRAVHVMSEYE